VSGAKYFSSSVLPVYSSAERALVGRGGGAHAVYRYMSTHNSIAYRGLAPAEIDPRLEPQINDARALSLFTAVLVLLAVATPRLIAFTVQ
jgi:hypothetical protein